ncbi:MAG: sigma-70 family RNA polymerase sigma factor, partial [Planctomycetaceae bacterium]|nr:sigma-70 family RNA polymerase sigma factor [Planctomycetaceae bacterium]
LKQVAVRMSINHVLRKKAETALEGGEFASVVEERESSPLTNLMKSETAHEVWDCLDKLREMDRRTLVAFYFEGQSLREMSDLFDSPVGTIKRRLHTARNRLKTELAGSCGIG